MKKLFLLLTVLSLASCKTANQPLAIPADRFVIEDLVKLTSEEIKTRYPDADIKEAIGIYEEGTEERPYCILFPNTPNHLEITWKDLERTEINDIRFTDKGNWKSSTGIGIGTTFNQLNKLNGKQVYFYGFGWDYSGAVDWNDGKFENSGLFVFLEARNIPGAFYGDHIIKASAEEIAALNLKVQTLIFKN
ncbi:hypothetical protein ACKGJN_03995 [Gillisia sp. Q332]|uniref:hypothetical protein n=1 Tax=Gillisia xinjiangensis TaxID=3384765 RepID=UPI00391B973E